MSPGGGTYDAAVLIAQISDCHITGAGELFADRIDSAERLADAVRTINALDPRPDLVLATGDLVNDGHSDQYDRLCAILDELAAPLVPIVGNHDDRQTIRRRFGDVVPPGEPDEPADFAVDAGPLRLVVLDTAIRGRNDGRLTELQLGWLDTTLAAEPRRPTIVVQHHPPFASGIPWMDADNGFDGADAEAAVLDRHPHVVALVAGHLHRSIQRSFGSTTAIVCPSTAAQLGLDLRDGEIVYTDEPPAMLLHHWLPDTGLNTHVVPIGRFDRWTPSWAGSAPT